MSKQRTTAAAALRPRVAVFDKAPAVWPKCEGHAWSHWYEHKKVCSQGGKKDRVPSSMPAVSHRFSSLVRAVRFTATVFSIFSQRPLCVRGRNTAEGPAECVFFLVKGNGKSKKLTTVLCVVRVRVACGLGASDKQTSQCWKPLFLSRH